MAARCLVNSRLERLRALEADLTRLLEYRPDPGCPEPEPVAAAADWWCAEGCTDSCEPSEGR